MKQKRDHYAWTDDEQAMLRALLDDAVGYSEIGRRMGRTTISVANYVYRQIGPKTRRRGWTTRDLAEARRLRDEGMTYAEIGKRIGRTHSTVYQALNRG
jgi:IS30 family transposase